jgi:hypothetical protein
MPIVTVFIRRAIDNRTRVAGSARGWNSARTLRKASGPRNDGLRDGHFRLRSEVS